MAVSELVERVTRWASEPPRDARLARARADFERRTAPIEIDQPDYESRIAHFLDGFICERSDGGEAAPVEAFAAAHGTLGRAERRALAGLLRSHRGLWLVVRIAPRLELRDLLSGARFELRASGGRLEPGEVLDGRVLWDGLGAVLAPGRVFHPADSHASIRTLVADPRVAAMPRAHVLDALLAMRDRLRRFTRVRAEHLYTAEAIGSEAFSATWKRAEKAHDASEEAPRSKGP